MHHKSTLYFSSDGETFLICSEDTKTFPPTQVSCSVLLKHLLEEQIISFIEQPYKVAKYLLWLGLDFFFIFDIEFAWHLICTVSSGFHKNKAVKRSLHFCVVLYFESTANLMFFFPFCTAHKQLLFGKYQFSRNALFFPVQMAFMGGRLFWKEYHSHSHIPWKVCSLQLPYSFTPLFFHISSWYFYRLWSCSCKI